MATTLPFCFHILFSSQTSFSSPFQNTCCTKGITRMEVEEASSHHEAEEEVKKPSLSFRSYRPIDEGLDKLCRPPIIRPSKAPGFHQTCMAIPRDGGEDGIVLVSKNINSDLKREIAHKVEVLEERTQAAMMAMIREKVREASAGDATDLASIVASHTHG
eukprot:TRINITY_DN655_c0_g1_i1.p1 TRINITY_DN655_c0_g1~~TRINITY_DN655_c0_g1_i1.p1  ORF type:complete len:167 (-),score=42.94 TRINITY_DN655_c0_g1_i1:693-1172(-)